MKKYFFGNKKLQYYKGILIKADLGLHDQVVEKIQELVPSGGKILDFGAGEGALSERLCDMGYQVTAVDKDGRHFKSKRANFYSVDFDFSDDLNNFVKNYEENFDAVLAIEVIEHIQDQWKFVNMLLRMVKSGGGLIITTPNITSWISRVIFFLTGRFHQFGDEDLSYGHINPISPWELELILKKSGAGEIDIVPAGTLPAIYIQNTKIALLNLLVLPFRPLMKGIVDGWCVMAVARKP